MNDSEFENHLRGLLRPIAPAVELRERIGEELASMPKRASIYSGRIERPAKGGFFAMLIRDFGWACVGAAAAVAVLVLWPSFQKTSPKVAQTTPAVPEASTLVASNSAPAPTNAFEHDETTNELVSTQGSDQLVETDDGPAREVRYTYLERHEWSNPHTGARVYLEVPREDVYLLPVALQ